MDLDYDHKNTSDLSDYNILEEENAGINYDWTVFGILNATICITGLIGNVGVLVHLLQKVSKWTGVNFLLANLAGVNIIYSLSIPIHMAFWLPVQILAWMKTKGFCYFYSFAEIIFGDVPALTLLCLTIERCLLLRRPATSMKTGSCRLAILLIWILTLIGWLPYVIHIEYVTSWHYPLCLVRWSAYHWHVIPVIQRSFEVIVLLVVGILCCWIFFTLNCQEEGTEIPLQITRESKTGRKLTQLTYSVGPIFALGCVPIRILILLISTMQDISVIPNLQLVSHCLNTWDYASILVLPLLYLCKHPYSRESNRPVCADEEIEIEIPFRRSI